MPCEDTRYGHSDMSPGRLKVPAVKDLLKQLATVSIAK
jgi:hypothetical protein